MMIKAEEKSETLITGQQGEFAGYYSKWIPYTRLRATPAPVLEFIEKQQPLLKIPMLIKIQSNICEAEAEMTKMPIDSVTFIMVPKS